LGSLDAKKAGFGWPPAKKEGAVLCDLCASNERQRVGGEKSMSFLGRRPKKTSLFVFLRVLCGRSERSERPVQKSEFQISSFKFQV
jgi:hypothetical protein